ncbi:hypothetical protein T484DRAFT_1757076 [Baffinella frigidus]|nr:hypothetical protein T484DRAFT_1757076 [Cryptophyta sp. CCMP2293]
MFSLSNNQFVRQTVEEFYRHMEDGACMVQRSARSEETLKQNEQMVADCAVTNLETFKKLLKFARIQVGSFVRSGYFLTMIILQAVRLGIPGMSSVDEQTGVDDAITQMGIYMDLLMQEIAAAFAALMDLLMKTRLGTEVGEWLEGLMQTICIITNWIMKTFFLDLFCPLRGEFVKAMDSVITNLEPIATTQIAGWYPFAFLNIDALKGIQDAMKEANCDPYSVLQNCTRVEDDSKKTIPCIDVATRCWSTYVKSLGDASSLSCSAADSCLQYDSNDEFAENGLSVCDDCPLQPLQDFQQFGCDTVRKQCKCNVQTISRTACINHAQCQDSQATCGLLDTAFLPTSFGTTPCQSCASGPSMCIDAPGGARCACPLRNQGFETCSVNDVSKGIVPDPLALCLVTLGSGTQNDASRSVDYSLSYSDLAAAPCEMLLTAQTFCYTVYGNDFNLATFVVGLERLDVGRRCLLEENVNMTTVAGMLHIAAHDLERVAALPWDTVIDKGCRRVGPLGSLSEIGNISVSDHVLYKRCLRWRAIGDDVRRSFNLTVPDTFLLSMADLADVLSDPAVVVKLVSHPEMVVYTMLHSEAAAPVRAFIRSVRIWFAHSISYLIEQSHWFHKQRNATRNTNHTNTTDSNTTQSGFESTKHRMHTVQSLLYEIRRATPMPYIAPFKGVDEPDTTDNQEEDTQTEGVPENSETTHKRNLLTFQEKMNAVKTCSTQLALGDGATQLMGGTLSDAFLNIPISFTDNEFELECTVVWNIGTVVMESFSIVSKFFGTAKPGRPLVEWGLASSLPSFGTEYRKPDANNMPIIEPAQNSAAGSISRYIFETMGGIDGNYVRNVVANIPSLVKRVLRCDIDSVMYCTEFRYSILSGGVVVAVFLYIVGIIISTLGVPYTWTVLAIIYVPIVLFYSLGYSPLCAPMIPTCIGEEIIEMFNVLLPTRVEWPQALQKSVNCIDNVNITASECLVSCSAHPLNFHGWYENAAWFVCELNIDACQSAHNWLRTQSFAATPDAILYDLSSAFWRSHMIITQADADMMNAYRFCAILSSWRLVPVLFLGILCIYTIPVLIATPLHLIFSALKMTMDVLSMSHTHERED